LQLQKRCIKTMMDRIRSALIVGRGSRRLMLMVEERKLEPLLEDLHFHLQLVAARGRAYGEDSTDGPGPNVC
jgi:hypothetical protein